MTSDSRRSNDPLLLIGNMGGMTWPVMGPRFFLMSFLNFAP